MRCVPHMLCNVRGDLRVAKDYIRENTYIRLGNRSPTRQPGDTRHTLPSPWKMERGRGMVRHSDRYYASQYVKHEREAGAS